VFVQKVKTFAQLFFYDIIFLFFYWSKSGMFVVRFRSFWDKISTDKRKITCSSIWMCIL